MYHQCIIKHLKVIIELCFLTAMLMGGFNWINLQMLGHLTWKAYDCQLEYMRAVVRSLENGENLGVRKLKFGPTFFLSF